MTDKLKEMIDAIGIDGRDEFVANSTIVTNAMAGAALLFIRTFGNDHPELFEKLAKDAFTGSVKALAEVRKAMNEATES